MHKRQAKKSEHKAQYLTEQYKAVRQQTVAICQPLAVEDYAVQPRSEVSPPKWHLGHTSWLFEEVILNKHVPGYAYFNQYYCTLFNSYYKAIGAHTIQSERGQLSRPTVAEILAYREHVDRQMIALLSSNMLSEDVLSLIETAIHHEQQHQELLYMDIKNILASNGINVAYSTDKPTPKHTAHPTDTWLRFEEGLYVIGHADKTFSYDNERPQHQHYLYPFAIQQRLITNGEFLAFINDHAYEKAQYWLSLGWDWINQAQIKHPLYWRQIDDVWHEYTLYGLQPLDLNQPVAHISYFEADAFANWKQLRLPTEQELEVFLNTTDVIQPTGQLHPDDVSAANGQLWCWTRSQYSPYPRFKAFDGILNEYNGKFMCNQFVLKGSCIVTPRQHYRHSYRNFYLPHQRWMFSGIRLAKDID